MRQGNRIQTRFSERLESKVPPVDPKADTHDFARYDDDNRILDAFRDNIAFPQDEEEELDAD